MISALRIKTNEEHTSDRIGNVLKSYMVSLPNFSYCIGNECKAECGGLKVGGICLRN